MPIWCRTSALLLLLLLQACSQVRPEANLQLHRDILVHAWHYHKWRSSFAIGFTPAHPPEQMMTDLQFKPHICRTILNVI